MPTQRLRLTLPTDIGGGFRTDVPEIVDTQTLPPQLPTVGVNNFDIYVPRDTLERYSPPAPSEIPSSLSGANSIIPYLLGESRTVALPYYVGQTGIYYTFMCIVGEGEINSYRTLIVDGKEFDVSASPIATAFTLSGLGICTLYTGDGVQNVSTVISSYITGYPDVLPDFAVLFLRIPYTQVQNEPRVEVVVRGKEIKDYTNSGTVGYTDNMGNILAHWVEEVEGLTIDTASATALANACAEDVGGSPRRSGGFAFRGGPRSTVIRDVLRAHAAAIIFAAGGVYKFVPDRPADSVMDIGQSMILGDVSITTTSLRSIPGDVVVSYVDIATGLAQKARATDVITNQPSPVPFTGITDPAQAKREAVERYNHLNLERETVRFTVKAEGLLLEPGDVFKLTDRRVGIKDKPYRCLTMGINTGEVVITAKEYQPGVYSDSTQVDGLIPDTVLPLDYSVPQVAPNFVGDSTVTQDNGDTYFQIDISWPSVSNNTLRGIRVLATDNDNGGEQSFTLPADATSFVYRTDEPNTSFTFDITCIGVYSDGVTSTVSRSTNLDNTFTPNAKYVEAGNDILVTWGDKVPNYVKQFFVLITNNTVGGSDTENVGLNTKEVFPDSGTYSVTFTSGHSYTVTIQSENRTGGTSTDSVTFTLP